MFLPYRIPILHLILDQVLNTILPSKLSILQSNFLNFLILKFQLLFLLGFQIVMIRQVYLQIMFQIINSVFVLFDYMLLLRKQFLNLVLLLVILHQFLLIQDRILIIFFEMQQC